MKNKYKHIFFQVMLTVAFLLIVFPILLMAGASCDIEICTTMGNAFFGLWGQIEPYLFLVFVVICGIMGITYIWKQLGN